MNVLMIVGALSLGQVEQFGSRELQPAPYPGAMVDSTARPHANGRLWVSRPMIGGLQVWARESGNPGAEAYGAFGLEDATARVQVQGLFRHTPVLEVEISPWRSLDTLNENASPYSDPYSRAREVMGERLELARRRWLQDQGFTGGVRTFINDKAIWGEPGVPSAASEPEPAATFQIPEDMPRGRGRLRADGASGPRLGTQGRVSLPMNAPADLAARIEANEGCLGPAADEVAAK